MGKIGTSISFDRDFLNKLKNDRNACVEIHTETYHLALHPFHLTDINSSIKGILNEKIAKYDKKFGGILLGYQNIKLLDSVGGINFDSCFIHVDIQADFYIFNPNIAQILNGIVNKKSKDHVGCLVHNTFNVSLPKPENSENWIGDSAQLGQEIQFEIIFTDLNGRLPYIKGKILSILSDDSGFSTSEEPQTKDIRQNTITRFDDSDEETTDKPKKKKRKHEQNSMEEEDGHKSKRRKQEIEKSKKKHKKKDRELASPICDEVDVSDDIPVKVKKKRKHKGEKNDSCDELDHGEVVINKSKRKKLNKKEMGMQESYGEIEENGSKKSKSHKKRKHKSEES